MPGDIDEVNTLRMRYDRSEEPPDVTDPHTPSSLLKLWFRELEFPLIPDEFYLECINNSHNSQQCIALAESLPKLNRTVFFSLLRFLQVTPAFLSCLFVYCCCCCLLCLFTFFVCSACLLCLFTFVVYSACLPLLFTLFVCLFTFVVYLACLLCCLLLLFTC